MFTDFLCGGVCCGVLKCLRVFSKLMRRGGCVHGFFCGVVVVVCVCSSVFTCVHVTRVSVGVHGVYVCVYVCLVCSVCVCVRCRVCVVCVLRVRVCVTVETDKIRERRRKRRREKR